MQSKDDLRQVLEAIQEQIRTADQKAAALLTIAGVLIAFPAPSILIPNSPNIVPFPAAFCAALAAVAFVVSICSALYVLFPRTTNKTNTSSLIYFGDIAGLTLPAFTQAVNRADDDLVKSDLIAQVHINAQIAQRKHTSFKWSVGSLVAGIILLTVAYGALAWGSPNRPQQGSPTTQTQRP